MKVYHNVNVSKSNLKTLLYNWDWEVMAMAMEIFRQRHTSGGSSGGNGSDIGKIADANAENRITDHMMIIW